MSQDQTSGYASIGLKSHIWNNNMKSMILLGSFPVLIFSVSYIIVAAIEFFKIQELADKQRITPEFLDILTPALGQGFGETLLITPYIVLGATIWFVIAYFFHQKMVERMSHAHLVGRKEHLKLYNMVENLSISRGFPMPRLCMIDSPQLNAFASGLNNKTYTITVTTGILDALSDEELEGVLAHELTHILNKDVRLMIIAVIFVGIFSTLLEMLFRSMFYGRYGRRSSGSSKNNGFIIIVAMVALGLGYLMASLIRLAMSRKREFMADAGAVELTKNPTALSSALEKISGKAKIEDMPDEMRGMCFENPPKFQFFSGGIFSIFSTHPPIEKRIEILKALT